MSSPLYLHYLQDILENAQKAREFVKGMSGDEFLQDEKTVFAVIRALEVIGEATKYIPEVVRMRYPHIPWRDMAGMRDKLIHQYFGVKLDVVWQTVIEDLPFIQVEFEKIVKREVDNH